MPIARSTVVGATTGVLLLAGAVAFGVGLPEVVGDGEAYAGGDLPTLPDRLDDRMVALPTLTGEDAGITDAAVAEQIEQVAQNAGIAEEAAVDNLTGLYGAAVIGTYVDAEAINTTSSPAELTITVIPGEPGLVSTSGPLNLDQGGVQYELVEVGGHNCAVTSREPVDPTTGMPTGEERTGSDYQVNCRADADGLAVDAFASGLTPDEVADYLDLVVEQIEG